MIRIIRLLTMPQVSRYPLKPETWNKIFNLFLHTFASINKKSDLSRVFYDLLSSTERIMLAKRLAIALLLVKKHNYNSIKHILHVTTGTIAKIQKQLLEGQGGLQIALEKIFKAQQTELLWEEIKDLLDVPPPSFHKSEWGKRKYQRKQKINRIKSSL